MGSASDRINEIHKELTAKWPDHDAHLLRLQATWQYLDEQVDGRPVPQPPIMRVEPIKDVPEEEM